MKKRLVSVALLAVLSTMAVSCQKETVAEPQSKNAELGTVYTVRYAVNGITHTETLGSDAEYDALLLRLFALARMGYEVEIMNGDGPANATLALEVITFSTTNEQEAIAWVKQKALEGYRVHMSFDQTTGTYNCIAYR